LAELLWGNVYYADTYCGILREETGNRYTFQYDRTYTGPPIAHLIPVRTDAYSTEYGLHPFFDNLLAEGWLASAQSRLLGKREARPVELLLAFGHDCAGAVSVIDPSPRPLSNTLLDPTDAKSVAAYRSRASLSGIQPKLSLKAMDNSGRPRVARSAHT
jgi:serine/threonine-protein kinase HipA